MLTLQVHEQKIDVTTKLEFVRGTVGALCEVNFDDFWEDYEKIVVFKYENGKPINILANNLNNTIEIPPQTLAESGKFKIGVFGITETETLPTLWSEDIKILYGTDTYGTAPPEYTPNEIEQLRISKQDKLIAGNGITISKENVISTTNSGGNIGTAVDQTYNPESKNAQSGIAVAEAIGSINNHYELIEKIVVGYSVLTSKPEDWESNFTAYYKNTGTLREPVYTALTVLEVWDSG